MRPKPLRVLQLNTYEQWGGAEVIARSLFKEYRRRGLDSFLAVKQRFSDDPGVLVISHEQERSFWYRLWIKLERHLRVNGGRWTGRLKLHEIAARLAEPARFFDRLRGIECFRFPGTSGLLDLPPKRPDIVHGHNLHGDYFDLRALDWLGRKAPVVLTLHDSWLFTGHCAQSFDCMRWKTGCGRCPDLTIYPDLLRDGTAYNWRRKKAIYTQSRLYVATPSTWLMDRVKQSMLAPAIADARVIPNGVDRSVFKPGDKRAVRNELAIPQNARVLLCVASGIRRNQFRDYQTIFKAVESIAAELTGSQMLLLALGESAEAERIGRGQVRFVPFESDRKLVAKYYQAADIYLHAARADTFPTTVIEALACGTPVIATAIGGIPEQIKSLNLPFATKKFHRSAAALATGVLVDAGDADAIAGSVVTILDQVELYKQVSKNAANDARLRFDLNHQCDVYLDWYNTILAHWDKHEF